MFGSRTTHIVAIFIGILLVTNVYAEPDIDELRQQMKQLMNQVQLLDQKLQQMEAKQTNQLTVEETAGDSGSQDIFVNLEPNEQASLDEKHESHVLANPWWKNIEIHGFGAAGYYDTGSAGTRNFGGFAIKESSLFIEADVWEDISLFWEIQANRLGKDDQLFVRTGEVYIHLRDIPVSDLFSFGTKLGRFDIPFGEEYLWQDSIDNPLISNSAAYPYGWDEGILVYSEFKGLNWILAVTDGTDSRSIEENFDKAVNLKFYGNPFESLYLSASYMRNGEGSKSAVEFGGSHFQPVGASHQSSVGSSSSDEIDSSLVELDAKYSYHSTSFDGYLATSLGGATQDDNDSSFDRDFIWFSVEPFLSYKNTWYAVARYSEIGTYDNHKGYHFDGKTFAGGNRAFGYDTRRFRRLALGIGWTPNPHLRAKLEVGQDWFDLIDASSLAARSTHRKFVGFEVAAGF